MSYLSKTLLKIRLRLNRRGLQKRIEAKSLKGLFIVSHARSGSSILRRVLYKNSKITGLHRRMIEYHSNDDLLRLALESMVVKKQSKRKIKYLVDRIFEEDDMPIPEMFQNSKFLFFVREPKYALYELYKMSHNENEIEEIYNSYTRSLNNIVRIARIIPSANWKLVTFKEFREDTGDCVFGIERFLKIKPEINQKIASFNNLFKKSRKNQLYLSKNQENEESNNFGVHNFKKMVYLDATPNELKTYIEKAEKDYQYTLHLLRTYKHKTLKKSMSTTYSTN